MDTRESFRRSRVTGELDDFISHDWQTARFAKLAALCVVYNLRAVVFVMTILVAILNLLVLVLDINVHHKVFDLFYPFLFALLLLEWQRLARFAQAERMVFVDKLCIDQANDATKRECILGLAGFLNFTQRLVILWSPRYFSRLWCAYEVVSWFYLTAMEMDGRELKLMPTAYALGMLGWTFAWCIVYFTSGLVTLVGRSDFFMGYLIVCAVIWPTNFIAVRFFCDTRRLHRQIMAFSLTESQCFCCAHDHIHPQTGESMSCDRALVYETLREWATSMNSGLSAQHSGWHMPMSQYQPLTSFDRLVRARLIQLMRTPGACVFKYVLYSDAVLIAAPAVWAGIGSVRQAYVDEGELSALRWSLEWCVLSFCVWPIALRWSSFCISNCAKAMDYCRCCPRSVADVINGTVATSTTILLIVVLWFPGPYFIFQGLPVWADVVRALVMASITFAVYYYSSRFQLAGAGYDPLTWAGEVPCEPILEENGGTDHGEHLQEGEQKAASPCAAVWAGDSGAPAGPPQGHVLAGQDDLESTFEADGCEASCSTCTSTASTASI
eukprot:TRINITY_DN14002_c0_g1_i1.p1 TRINITY_DN14002_c0_g1~~TRINITY_DN14002_c0_g1_i1.p1  ORF type:complete len:554 (-),score=23.77 TRINITY_DN14002_c0_g1_i1:20-1681(-)